ncbi:hypothetical protein MKX01_026422 [Papaver californicum]|nr:hypothetical protein MKX01_026422 [Papaver californicum]
MKMENGNGNENPMNRTMEEDDDDFMLNERIMRLQVIIVGFRGSEMGDNNQQQFCRFDSSCEVFANFLNLGGSSLSIYTTKLEIFVKNPNCYSRVAQLFQEFQFLFEPFEQGLRPEIYDGTKSSFTKMLQVPSIQVAKKIEKEGEQKDEEEESDEREPALGSDLIGIIKTLLLIFHVFLKMDQKKESKILSLFGGQNHVASCLQLVQSALDKELRKKKEVWKKKTWPATTEEVKLLFGLKQLLWWEEKMSKLNVSESRLKRDGSPILFLVKS